MLYLWDAMNQKDFYGKLLKINNQGYVRNQLENN